MSSFILHDYKFCIAQRFRIFIFHATVCFPQVRREGQAANDRHRQPGLPPGNGGRVRGHGLEPRRLRHQRLSQVSPGLQRRQQEGPRQDEGRIQRSSHRRVRRPEAQDVLHLGGRRPREEEGERHLDEDHVEDDVRLLPHGAVRRSLVEGHDAAHRFEKPTRVHRKTDEDGSVALRRQTLRPRRRDHHAGLRTLCRRFDDRRRRRCVALARPGSPAPPPTPPPFLPEGEGKGREVIDALISSFAVCFSRFYVSL